MTPKAARYAVATATGLAIALSLTACKGASPDKAAGAGTPTTAGAKLTAAQSALSEVSDHTSAISSFRGTLAMAIGASGRRTQIHGTMACRFKPTKAVKVNLLSPSTSGRGTQRITEVIVGDKLYMKIPGSQAQTGKPWVGIDLSELSKASGVDTESLRQGSQDDPAVNTRMLTASKDVRVLGSQMVGGVRTTHYKGTISLADGLAKLTAQQRAQAQKSFTQLGVDRMNFDLWADAQQLPRRFVMATPAGAKVSTKMTMNYTAFNVPVSVTAPPKSQVADGSGLLGGGGQNMPS
jgi:hypothetical protein